MSCPHLVMYDRFYCVSTNESYRPSPHQLKEYCHEGRHQNCPYFKSFMDNVELFSYSL
jgi:hypothetical protein